MSEQVQKGAFEKHAQTVVQILIAGLCLWMAATITETSKQVAVLSVKIDALEEDKDNKYMADDAAKDQHMMNTRMDSLENRLRALENRN